MFCGIGFWCLFSFTNHMLRRRKLVCFVCVVLRLSRLCVSVSLAHGAVGLSAVCDCGISWSFSLTFCLCVYTFVNCSMFLD